MPNPTPAEQVAALAELVGITPERYPNLACHHLGEGIKIVVAWLPDPLGPDADGVWLAPAMWWITKHEYGPLISGSHVNAPCYACITIRTGDVDSEADTFTAALLQACLAARVPEVCAILEVNE